MPRSRTQKQVARRINIFYFRESSGVRKARRALIVLCTLAALGWIGFAAARSQGNKGSWLDPVTLTKIHNPGHLASAHASFEQQCQMCHVGVAGGKFTRNVTDQACLTCHDGSIHDEHQTIAEDPSKVSRKDFALAISDEHRSGTKLRSAGCIECHTEHRGEAALRGNDNHNCVLCHENPGNKTSVIPQHRVAAFEPKNHPEFGEAIIDMSTHKLSAPPKIKFNHAYHFTQTDLKSVKNNCTVCHSSEPPANVNAAVIDDNEKDPLKKVPPYQSWTDADIAASKTASGAYMRPVSYATHCIACHPLILSDNSAITLPHKDMPTVSAVMADLPAKFKAKLAAMSEEQRKSALTVTEKKGRTQTTKEITEDEWINKQMMALKQSVSDWTDLAEFKNADDTHLPSAFKDALTAKLSGDDPPDQFVLQSLASYAMFNGCAKCHDMQITSEQSGGRGRKKASGPPTIATAPTGLSSTVQRWYVTSRFDHRAHRNLQCVDCHFKATESGPDAAPKTAFAVDTGSADVLLPDLALCASCHKPAGASVQAATGECISCHVFHDRTKEQMVSLNRSTAEQTDTPEQK